jgi:hypothetical protein
MKTADASVVSYLQNNNVTWRGDLFTFTLASGAVLRWTTADATIVNGGNTYLADGSVLSRGKIRQTAKLEVDTLDIKLGGPVLLSGLTIAARAAAGYFDGARLRLDHLVGSPSMIPIASFFEGRVADVQVDSPMVVSMTIKAETEVLNQLIPRFVYRAPCGNTLYDANCKVVKTSTGCFVAAAPAPTTTSFGRTPTTPAIGLGFVEFVGNVTPALAGVRRAVLTDASGVCTVSPALPVAPASGDQLNAYRGCDLTRTTCNSVFGNAANNRSFTHIPKPSDAG